MEKKLVKAWIEAMRPRTLPVSLAGVIAGTACAIFAGGFNLLPALCCFLFALLAQIASNFANEYFDYKNGFDKKGREGFRRGVTEGDIPPGAMKAATYITLLLAAIPGCALIIWGGWWLILIGIIICIFALAYSAGPYPLSHHGLGDIAVVIFFGLVPVCFTAWLQALTSEVILQSLPIGLGVGLMAANVLIVNNYRDMEDDAAVGKHTTVVIFGRPAMANLYLCNNIIGLLLLCSPMLQGAYYAFVPILLLPAAIRNWKKLKTSRGALLNPLLKSTALLLLAACLILLIESLIFRILR